MSCAASADCKSDFESFSAFNQQLHRALPDHKTPAQLDEWLRQNAFSTKTLSPLGLQAVAEGQNPYLAGWLRRAMQETYARIIIESDLHPDKKMALREALNKAVADLEASEQPLWSVDNEIEQRPPTVEEMKAREALEAFVRGDALKRCILRAGILVGVSESLTATSLMVKNWAKYASGDESTIDHLVSPKTYANALEDRYLDLQLTSNFILMSAIGGLRCFPRSMILTKIGMNPDGWTGRYILNQSNVVAALAAASSIVSQRVVALMSDDDEKKKHWLSWNQVLLDTGWTRFISVWKTGKVYQGVDALERAGVPHRAAYEAFLQAVSESGGSIGYSYLQDWLRHRGLLPRD